MYSVIIPSYGALIVRFRHGILRLRAERILERKSGMMKSFGAVVQHFNPACRVARQFPHLISSRLLMSLGDFDIPIKEVLDYRAWDWVFDLLISILIYIELFLFKLLPPFLAEPLIDMLGTALVSMIVIALAALFYIENASFIAVVVFLLVAFFGRWALVEYQRAHIPNFMKTNEEKEIQSAQHLLTHADSETGNNRFNKFGYKSRWFWKKENGYVIRGKAGWLSGVELLNRDLNIDAMTNSMLKIKPSAMQGGFSPKMSPLSININSPLRSKPSPSVAYRDKLNKVSISGDQFFQQLELQEMNDDGWASSGIDGEAKPQASPSLPVNRSLIYDVDSISNVSMAADDADNSSVASKYYLMDWTAEDEPESSGREIMENQLFLGFAADETGRVSVHDSDVKSVQSIESLFTSLASSISYK